MTTSTDSLRILITGADGQVGTELKKAAPPHVSLLALNRGNLDITDRSSVNSMVEGFRPHWIINSAAYTDVDRAEAEQGVAFAVNRDGVLNLSLAAAKAGAKMMHISTDYVFNGLQNRPYRADDLPGPVNVYGESKLAGEKAAREALGDDVCILRASWVYSERGRNFLTTMLRLMSERTELRVIEDQVGTPTSAANLSSTIYAAVEASLSGVYHWTDSGVASWYDFAAAIQDLGGIHSESIRGCRIIPIRSDEYSVAARRPSYSVLDKSLIRGVLRIPSEHWRHALEKTISRL